MRTITSEYRKVVEAAESLAERDFRADEERLKGLEERIEEAVGLLEAKDKEIEDRDHRVSAMRSTVHDIVRILGTFIQANLPSWVDTITDPRTQQVLHVVADYTRDGIPGSVDYVRVPEDTLTKYVTDLREARALNVDFHKVLHGQSAVIKDQSQKLDAQVVKFENAVKLVQSKDHEILLLSQRIDDLARQLQNSQVALAENRDAAAEAETGSRRYDELRGNMESLKTAHELELDQKDAEIANLRQKLGSAREEVITSREDVKNVASQKETMLQTQTDPPHATTKTGTTSKALKFFGLEKDKYKKINLPGSQSTLGLSTVDLRHSSKGVAPAVSKEELHHRPSLQTRANPRSTRSTPSTPIDLSFDSSGLYGASFATGPLSGSHGPAPPRLDSLGAPQQYGGNPTSPAMPADRFKPLPKDPKLSQLATARLAGATSSIESPLQAQITSDYLSHGIMGQTQQSARRVLSRITEVSTPPQSRRSEGEDTDVRLERVREDDSSDNSVSSIDREVYRKSLNALDMLNSSSDLPHTETETDFERAMRASRGAGGSDSPLSRSINQRADASYYTQANLDGEYDNAQTSVARVLHVRPGNRNLRRSGGTHDGIAFEDPETDRRPHGVIGEGRPDHRPVYSRDREPSGESTQDRRERFRNPARESLASNDSSAGYRTEDSEPKTVAQMYHMGGKHIRG